MWKWQKTCSHVLAVTCHVTYSLISGNLNGQTATFCVINSFLCPCVCSSRKNALRLICRIASSSITTRAPRSVTTVAVCCGVSTDKAWNVKVSLISFLPWRWSVMSAFLVLTFFSWIVPVLHWCDARTRLWDERAQLLSEKSGQSMWNQPETTCRGSVSSLPGLHSNILSHCFFVWTKCVCFMPASAFNRTCLISRNL